MTPNQIKQEAANFNHTDAGFEADLVAFAKLILGKATGWRTIDPDDSDEAAKLADLLGAIDRAQAPSRHQGALL